MTAADGPYYANKRKYRTWHLPLTYENLPPSSNGFIRHVDKATGVPDWWKPITVVIAE
jgi:periplasmic iron binding protein